MNQPDLLENTAFYIIKTGEVLIWGKEICVYNSWTGIISGNVYRTWGYSKDGYIVLKWTGLYDKNGDPIREGDEVEIILQERRNDYYPEQEGGYFFPERHVFGDVRIRPSAGVGMIVRRIENAVNKDDEFYGTKKVWNEDRKRFEEVELLPIRVGSFMKLRNKTDIKTGRNALIEKTKNDRK